MSITPSIKRDYLSKLALQGRRADGRGFNEFREIKIETGYITKAEGSARVKIGNTQVVAGIKMDVGDWCIHTGQPTVLISNELPRLLIPEYCKYPPFVH